MIRSVLLDDEKNSLETLAWKLSQFTPQIEVIRMFVNPEEAVKWMSTNKFDLLFLDIEMPNLSGFDVLQALSSRISFQVIFTTAYENYGIQAVKFSALDYLLKPVRQSDLIEAVSRYQQRSKLQFASQQIGHLLNNLRAETNTGLPNKITLATKESLDLVEPREILYCQSDSNYTLIYLLSGEKKIISKTLRAFEEMLRPFRFFRTHNSYLANMNHVKSFVKGEGGYLLMTNGVQVPVSKSRKDQLMMYF